MLIIWRGTSCVAYQVEAMFQRGKRLMCYCISACAVLGLALLLLSLLQSCTNSWVPVLPVGCRNSERIAAEFVVVHAQGSTYRRVCRLDRSLMVQAACLCSRQWQTKGGLNAAVLVPCYRYDSTLQFQRMLRRCCPVR